MGVTQVVNVKYFFYVSEKLHIDFLSLINMESFFKITKYELSI